MNIVRNCAVLLISAAALATGLVHVDSNETTVAPESGRPAHTPQHCSDDCTSLLAEDGVRAPPPPSALWSSIPHYQQRSWVRIQGPEKSCRIDPNTGCHYGHKEESHPGGCHCN